MRAPMLLQVPSGASLPAYRMRGRVEESRPFEDQLSSISLILSRAQDLTKGEKGHD